MSWRPRSNGSRSSAPAIRNWAEGDGGMWCVMLDPEGNEFCVMPPDEDVA